MIQGGGIGWLTRRLGEWRLAIGGAVGVALSLATLPLATGGGSLLLSLTLLGLGSACFLPSVSGLVAMALSGLFDEVKIFSNTRTKDHGTYLKPKIDKLRAHAAEA
jgi:MFS family permease